MHVRPVSGCSSDAGAAKCYSSAAAAAAAVAVATAYSQFAN